jgi:hypothetical protein
VAEELVQSTLSLCLTATIEETMEMESSASSGLSCTATTQDLEYLNSSVHLAFSAADLALEHDLSVIRNLDHNTERSTALFASKRVGEQGEYDGDDCNSIAEELEYLASSHTQESIREELSEAEDCWLHSFSSLVESGRDVSEIEHDKPLDQANESGRIGCDNTDQIQAEMVSQGTKIGPKKLLITSFKGRGLFRKDSDDETVSTEEDSLQCVNGMSSGTADSSRATKMAETSETRRPKALTIETEILSPGSTNTNELLIPESPMDALLSSALFHQGHAGMSLALASDILASQIYSQQSLWPYWLNKQLGDRCGSEKLSPSNPLWFLGVPLIGSVSKDGQVWLMGNVSDKNTPTSLVEDETLDDMEAL